MFKDFIHFIKYNNFVVLGFLAFFVLGSGVFAQTEAGQEFIGERQNGVVGIDNTLLLEVDLDNFDMKYRIERIDEDKKYYYITYTYLDLLEDKQAWQYLINEKIRKVSKRSRVNLPKYLAEEFTEMYEARVAYLKDEKIKAELIGEEKRVETSEYSGLIGKSLDVVAKVFTDFETVKKKELPSPTIPPSLLPQRKVVVNTDLSDTTTASADSITNVYEDYIDRKDPDRDNIFGILDNCPNVYNPEQLDENDNGIGDVCEEVDNVDAIEDDDGTDLAVDTDEDGLSTDNTDETDDMDLTDEDSNAEDIDEVVTAIEETSSADEVVDPESSDKEADLPSDEEGTSDLDEDSRLEDIGDPGSEDLSSNEKTPDSSDSSEDVELSPEPELEEEIAEVADIEEEPAVVEVEEDLDVVIIEL